MAERHRLGLVVGDIDRRHAEPRLERCDVGAHLHTELRVEVRERLVHEEDARVAHDRAAHRYALPLAAGQLARLALEIRRQAEHLRDLVHAPVALRLLDARDLQRERDVRGNGEIRIERVVLEHHRDVALLRRIVGHVALADPDRAAVDLLEPREHPQRRCLPGPGRTDEHRELAVRDVQVERIHRGNVRPGIDARRLLEANLSHRRILLPLRGRRRRLPSGRAELCARRAARRARRDRAARRRAPGAPPSNGP